MSWSVTVERDGEKIITIETNCLSGRDLVPGDEDAIRTAAQHLLSFVGTVPDRETWWLVERKVQPPQYCVEGYTDLPSLTADPWRAARFATEREAFDYRLRLSSLRDECKETEHVFINKQ